MPYEKYKIHMRDSNHKKPKRTLTRERKATRDKLIFMKRNENNLAIFKEKKNEDIVSLGVKILI